MASEMVKVELWVVVDQDGDYSVSKDGETEAAEQYESDYVPLSEMATRRVKITIMVPRPKVVEITATVGDEPGVGAVLVS